MRCWLTVLRQCGRLVSSLVDSLWVKFGRMSAMSRVPRLLQPVCVKFTSVGASPGVTLVQVISAVLIGPRCLIVAVQRCWLRLVIRVLNLVL